MTLRIDIKADAGQAKRELKAVGRDVRVLGGETKAASRKMSAGFAGAGAAAAGFGLAVGAAAVAGAAKLIAMAAAVSEVGDETAKTARNLGITAEALQALSFASERSGVSQKTLNTGLKLLSKNMFEAANGSKRIADTFEDLGISTKKADGTLRPVEAVFRDLTATLGAMGESTEATAVRTLLLGRSGAELGNLMAGGVTGLDLYASELERLGGIMDQDLLDSSEAFQDALTDLKTASQGTRNELASGLIPEMQIAAKLFTQLSVGSQDAAGSFARNLIPSIRNTVVSFTSALPILGSVVTAMEAMRRAGAQASDGAEDVELFPLPAVEDMRAALLAAGAQAKLTARVDADKAKAAAEEQARDAKKQQAEAERQRQALVRHQAELSLLSLQIDTQRQLDDATDAFDAKRITAASEYAALRIALERDLTLGIKDEQTARLQDELATLRQQSELRAVAAEEDKAFREQMAAQASERAAAEQANAQQQFAFQNQVADASISMARGVSDAIVAIDARTTKSKGKAAKRAFAIQKAAAIASAVVGTASAVVNASQTVPFLPAGIAAAVTAGVLGAAQIATIAAQAPPSIIADAGLSPEMAQRMMGSHTTAIIRRDEAVIDPKGTREISQMLAIQRRQMELDAGGGQGGAVYVAVEATPETLRESAAIASSNNKRQGTPTSGVLRA